MAARSKNNLIAGGFLISCLIGFVLLSAVIADAGSHLTKSNTYRVSFSLADGAFGVKPGTAVLLGGQEIGRVQSVGFRNDEQRGVPIGVTVEVSVRADIALFEDAVFTLERPLLGNTSLINIVGVGTGDVAEFQGRSASLEEGETIAATIAAPSFLADAGYGKEQAQQVRNTISNAEKFSSHLAHIGEVLDIQIEPTFDNVQEISEELRTIVTGTREDMEASRESVRSLLDKLASTATRADQTMADASEVVATMRQIIADNRDGLDLAVKNASEAVVRLNEAGVPEALAIIKAARETMERIDALSAEAEPGIRRMLANARIASDQLKLTTTEVRRSPWRLLQRPSTKELESELVYNAASAYAQAVSDLRSASESLDGALALAEAGEQPDTERIAELAELLRRAFDEHTEAEERLLEVLLEHGP